MLKAKNLGKKTPENLFCWKLRAEMKEKGKHPTSYKKLDRYRKEFAICLENSDTQHPVGKNEQIGLEDNQIQAHVQTSGCISLKSWLKVWEILHCW